MSQSDSFDADVLVVGAGPAGLALGAALADAGLHALLLEQQPQVALEDPPEDGREIALTHRARRVMDALGLWSRIDPSEIAPLNEARVVDGGSPQVLHFGRGSGERDGAHRGGAQPLGWLVPNHRIRQAAWAAATARPGVQVLCDARVDAVEREAQRATVTLADGRRLAAPLLVAADSRFSATRRLAGIGAAMHDFGRSVVVGRVGHAQPHAGVAWECFGYGNTLALLPMNGQRVSAVVTLPADRAPQWLALSDAEFAARIEAQAEGRLGAVHAAGPRHHYPLVGVYAQRFVSHRFALIGDAAVGMHPVTAHGWNFGVYGVEVLARELAAQRRCGGDIGGPRALQAYEREHRHTTLPVWLGTNAIVTLFTDERRMPKLARRAVLTVAERAPGLSRLLKAGIERQLTGGGVAGAAPH
ncbi:MAG: 5-demethoxyubiquinol-8 5-hydroxylase UbiM [Ideonella sp.]|nr:5-demethoxyubiquinol-8 5-hydroxylase UbiM [Ideonella sp.]MCC7455569.1 5-demethoxyubiquinol-8 5-hydroxylase UbiM [Nitrospira sp.]